MSTDIYIPIEIVLSHPHHFQFEAALNGDMEDARVEAADDAEMGIDYNYIESCMKPVLTCKFGARETWRVVEVFDHDLHISVGGSFRHWLVTWLTDHQYKFVHTE